VRNLPLPTRLPEVLLKSVGIPDAFFRGDFVQVRVSRVVLCGRLEGKGTYGLDEYRFRVLTGIGPVKVARRDIRGCSRVGDGRCDCARRACEARAGGAAGAATVPPLGNTGVAA
jgi:hypothetical protein